MKIRKTLLVGALVLAGCNGGSEMAGVSVEESEIASLRAAMGTRESRFATEAELQAALERLRVEFQDARIRRAALAEVKDGTSRFDRFSVFVLTKLGKTWLRDQVVWSDTTVLEAQVNRATEGAASAAEVPVGTSATAEGAVGQAASALIAWPPATVQQNQGSVYKTQGESFVDNFVAYKQTGALTQFKKHRTRFFVTGWYDTDASRIGVRAIYFGNPDRQIWPELGDNSYAMDEGHDYNTNDDYVSDRRLGFGGSITFQIGPNAEGPSPGVNFSVTSYDGVYGLHSVDHAGYQWRLVTSRGLRSNVEMNGYRGDFYVPWL